MYFPLSKIAFVLLSSTLLFPASNDTKPECNRGNAGRFWPEAANHDAKVRNKMARCGELERCSHGKWRYGWESMTVRIDQLRGGSGLPKPAGCEILPDAAAETNRAAAGSGAQQ